jgi:hypothetical protein
VLKRYLADHDIQHSVRIVEEPETKVDALMLNIFSTPALVIGEKVLRQTEMFANDQLDVTTLLAFLRSNDHGTA